MATVLIIGASKGIGLETLKCALNAGHTVRALSRSANKIPISHANLEKITGDALDRAAVNRAIVGVDAVIQTLGVAPSLEMIFKRAYFFSTATRILVTAMEEMGVKRLISVTGYGAGDSRDKMRFPVKTAFSLLLGRVYDDKDVQERIIRNSTLDWLIARPVGLTNGPGTGAYRVLIDPKDWRSGSISRADVADFLVKQLDQDTFLGKTPVLVS
ncbi:Epimerase [Methylocella tundrae]|uniref:Epimerase n=1 Tax=Methylocella tundrae TaxID=227605 RepID=A0A8B6M0Y0_METTU|nr:SDR family oxidoreductase [Methylocella tundrae]VTZ26641.1 Epimerase [Methylocella tundrae]VTZ48711.1 Epimerase [Methylocella tundrae]